MSILMSAGGRGSVATVDKAGEGGILPPYVTYVGENGFGAQIVATADQVRVGQFVLPFRITVRKFNFEVTTLEVGAFAGAAIYDVAKNLLLEGRNGVDTTGLKTVTLASAVTLEPGVYWHAWAADGTVVAGRTLTWTANFSLIINAATPRRGTAANASTNAVFPATLGTISASGVSPLGVWFEP